MGNSNQAGRQAHNPNIRERLYKVVIIGDSYVGKTSLLSRYVENTWVDFRNYWGVDFRIKRIQWTSDLTLKLQIWDTAGQERFRGIHKAYYKRITGAFVCFDITDLGSFNSVKKWKGDIDSSLKAENKDPIPVILLANKCDLPHDHILELIPTLDEFCTENGFATWLMTSSKEGTNVDLAFHRLMEKMVGSDIVLPDLPFT